MESLLIQELIIFILSVAALAGGAKCIAIRDRHSLGKPQESQGKKSLVKKRLVSGKSVA